MGNDRISPTSGAFLFFHLTQDEHNTLTALYEKRGDNIQSRNEFWDYAHSLASAQGVDVSDGKALFKFEEELEAELKAREIPLESERPSPRGNYVNKQGYRAYTPDHPPPLPIKPTVPLNRLFSEDEWVDYWMEEMEYDNYLQS